VKLAAGIPKHAPGGKLDFHACRLAYISFGIEAGVTVKETQALARHSTPALTMNVYGRTGDAQLAATVEERGEICCHRESAYRVSTCEQQARRRNGKRNSLRKQGVALFRKWWRRRESNPITPPSPTAHVPDTATAKPLHPSALRGTEQVGHRQDPHSSARSDDASTHAECAICVQRNPCPDLARVVEAWPGLPQKIRTRILALADAAQAG
jgi:hypothetical protein